MRLTVEDAEEALVHADQSLVPGTARTALAHPDFRRLYFGAFGSNIGSWMQNAVLGAYAFTLTGSATFVGVITFAQLGPLLLLSVIGGALADQFDRRRLLLAVAVEQLGFSLAIAWLTRADDPSRVALVLLVLAIGAGQAVHAPTYSAVLPGLVGRRDLAGAISLNSVQMNASRVVGPAIGGVLFAAFGAPWVFALNAATYLAVIGVLLTMRFPSLDSGNEPEGLRRVLGGFRVVRDNQVVRRCLGTMIVFSLLCLPFVVQMPTVAARNLGVQPDSAAYGVLYACLGLGAVIGSLAIGTVLAAVPKRHIVPVGLSGFALAVAALALLRDPAPAYPVAVLVGICYFGTVTSLSTVLQERLDDRVRGRVMALWIMSFGGTVPIGGLLAGPAIEATSVTTVMLTGAAVAALLAGWVRLITARPAARGTSPGSP